MSVQLGSDSRLYFAWTTVTDPLSINTLANADGTLHTPLVGGNPATGATTLALATQLKLVDCVKDVNIGGSNNTVDTTCRESARQGFSTSKITTSDATMTLQMQYDERETYATGNNDTLDMLLYAFTSKSPVFAIDLDKELILATDNGARGLGGNWSVGFSLPKEVQGQVVVDVELALESKAQWLTWDGALFHALLNP